MKFTNRRFFISTYFLTVFLFFPAVFNFYSHDDFFHYKIAQASSIKEFLSFFDLTHAPENWGYYRPLTTQVLYFLGRTFFNFNPVIMHAIAFLLFFVVVFLVFKLVLQLTKNKTIAYFATLFYASSATHFSHLYSLANQELGHGLFFLSSTLFFVEFLGKRQSKYYFFSLLSFIVALTCKEFAIMLSAALVLVYGLLKIKKETLVSLKKFILLMLPFLTVLAVYLYLHVFHYGLVQGESYIWVFSPKTTMNSLLWYGLWSLNLPKVLIEFEFFKPGPAFNFSLFKTWPLEISLSFFLFGVLLFLLLSIIAVFCRKINKKETITYIFSFIWFSCTLLPILFLPWHKFTTYLTIPLIGVVIILGEFLYKYREQLILKKRKKLADLTIFTIFAIYIALSIITQYIARKNDWIPLGCQRARRVFDYLKKANYIRSQEKTVLVFYDQPEDKDLLLAPSREVKLALSDNNFFDVFFPGRIKAYYLQSEDEIKDPEAIRLPARQFVEY